MEVSHALTERTVLAGRYRIERHLAVGDVSFIYLARDMKPALPARVLVLKQYPASSTDLLQHGMLVRSFEHEADILATSSRPSIPQFFDYFTEGDWTYIAMQFVDGTDLKSLLEDAKGFLPEEQVAPWAIGICDSLQYIHVHKPHPILHRDVKPEHVILDPAGRTHLVGFAIACRYQPGQKGTALGTSAYAAPEQYEGTAGPKSDIDALGATPYHLLTGQPPSPTLPVSGSEVAARMVNPVVSMSMEAIISKAMRLNPDDRFESAKKMKAALIGLG